MLVCCAERVADVDDVLGEMYLADQEPSEEDLVVGEMRRNLRKLLE